MDLDEVFKERNPEELKKLLPKFRECKKYAERLDFWDQHNLHLKLNIDSSDMDIIDAIYFLDSKNELNIIPSSDEEARMLLDWGVPRRLQLLDRLNIPTIGISFNQRKEDFIKKYSQSYDIEFLLKTEFSFIEIPDDYELERKEDWWVYCPDSNFYNFIFKKLRLGEDTGNLFDLFKTHYPETDYITKNPLSDWKVIDTYLKAKSDSEYRAWLIELRGEHEKKGRLSFSDKAKTHGDNQAIEQKAIHTEQLGNITNPKKEQYNPINSYDEIFINNRAKDIFEDLLKEVGVIDSESNPILGPREISKVRGIIDAIFDSTDQIFKFNTIAELSPSISVRLGLSFKAQYKKGKTHYLEAKNRSSRFLKTR